jgi:hypothetical protein
MQKRFLFTLLILLVSILGKAQVKVVFNKNIAFTIPADWFVKDSTDKRIMLRKNGDQYSKIEIKIYEHKEKDLAKYLALDKKKFFPDKHTRTILKDINLGGRVYKKIKYLNSNNVVIANAEMEYAILWKSKYPIFKTPIVRMELIVTYTNAQEAAMLKATESLIASLKFL